jgi:DNA-binding transcriptional MerR regulator
VSDTPRRHLAFASAATPNPGPVAELDEVSLLQVGDLAKATGKTVRALHLYESLGLIEPAGRSKGRYRLFSPDTKVRVRWISKLQSLGLSLPDIQAIVQQRQSSESARGAARELREVYKTKLEDVRHAIREYRMLEEELAASVAFLEACDSACTTDESPTCCTQCRRHPEPAEPANDLILGARVEAPFSFAAKPTVPSGPAGAR